MHPINRRGFLRTSLTGAVAATQFRAIAAATPSATPKLNLGIIGCGGYGMADARAAFKAGGVEVLALCDVDSDHLRQSADQIEKLQGKRPKTVKHFQQLLETSGLDAVIIATPPQWHALPFIAALDAGLDVYCEKPLAYDVREGRAMVDAARKSGRMVQIGFQRRQAAAFQQAREHIREGKAGSIIQVDARIHYRAGIKDTTPQAPPESLDWDLWCGPAPKIPYSPQVGHVSWRLEKTTGHGHLVDWGIHLIDTTRWILGAGAPRTVTASGGIYHFVDKITTPDILTAHFEFEQCPVTWNHRIWGAEEYLPSLSNGILFFGEKETVFATDSRWEIIPRGRGQQRETHEVKSDAGTAQMAEFLEAVRTRQQPGCLPEDGHQSTTAVKLAMIAYETGRRIHWNAAQEEIVDDPAAAKLLQREYRAPWRHPYRAVTGNP